MSKNAEEQPISQENTVAKTAPQPRIVYYSGATEMTKDFVTTLCLPSERIPMRKKDGNIEVDYPYILVVPTYGAASDQSEKKNAVHRQIIEFLNNSQNRENCLAVIGSGNLNFGEAFIQGAKIVAGKLGVPLIERFELSGTPHETSRILEKIMLNWEQLLNREIPPNIILK